jgi:hypothetical protein
LEKIICKKNLLVLGHAFLQLGEKKKAEKYLNDSDKPRVKYFKLQKVMLIIGEPNTDKNL